jgi:hypothetical protein
MFYRMIDTKLTVGGKVRSIRTNRFFDGEETETETTETTETTTEKKKEAPKVGDQNPNTGRRYTQTEVNGMMKADKDAAKKERDKLQADLQKMKDEGLTTENMEALQRRIDDLASEGKTQEERTKEALASKDKEHAKQLGMTQAEAKKWRLDYEKYRAESEILAAASHYKADNPTQIHKLLKSDVVYVEKLDANNKGTGEWLPKVRMEVTEDGVTKALDMSPMDAVKKMTEMEEHHNLFNSGASSGIGGGNNGGSKSSGATAIPKKMGDYMAARKKNPRLLEGVGKEKK